jgi:hypothetical protein
MSRKMGKMEERSQQKKLRYWGNPSLSLKNSQVLGVRRIFPDEELKAKKPAQWAPLVKGLKYLLIP